MQTFDDVCIFRDLKGSAFLGATLRAHDHMVAPIQSAEVASDKLRRANAKARFCLRNLLFKKIFHSEHCEHYFIQGGGAKIAPPPYHFEIAEKSFLKFHHNSAFRIHNYELFKDFSRERYSIYKAAD